MKTALTASKYGVIRRWNWQPCSRVHGEIDRRTLRLADIPRANQRLLGLERPEVPVELCRVIPILIDDEDRSPASVTASASI